MATSSSSTRSVKNIVLSQELREHYRSHGVTGIESYICQQQQQQQGPTSTQTVRAPPPSDIDIDTASTGTNSNTNKQLSSERCNTSSSGSRFIRLNPRFDKRETLRLLTDELSNQRLQQQQQQSNENENENDPQSQSQPQQVEDDAVGHHQSEPLPILMPIMASPVPTPVPVPVPWINPQLDFYAIPNDFHLSQSKVFRDGRVYGMDVSSGAAVDALLLRDDDNHDDHHRHHSSKKEQPELNSNVNMNIQGEGDDVNRGVHGYCHDDDDDAFRVLDLCCAPGLKTCAIADLLKPLLEEKKEDGRMHRHHHPRHPPKKVVVVGVDISEKRIQLCKNIVKKYHIDPETSSDRVGVGVGVVVQDPNQDQEAQVVGQQDENQNEMTTTVTTNSTTTSTTPNRGRMTIQLYQTDGTTFGTLAKRSVDAASLIFDSNVAHEQQRFAGKRKRMNRSARARERKRLKSIGANVFRIGCGGSGGDGDGDDSRERECVDDDENAHHESMNGSTCAMAQDDSIILPLFDRVLVDAECSTDGALRHMQCKYNQLQVQQSSPHMAMDIGEDGESSTAASNPKEEITAVTDHHPPSASALISSSSSSSQLQKLTTNAKLTDAKQLQELVALQKKLIASGFRLLKKGGAMVYSTCSLAREQNEDVVSWLLEQYPNHAEIVPVSFSSRERGEMNKKKMKGENTARSINHHHRHHESMISEGLVKGTVRFHPATMSSSSTNSSDMSNRCHDDSFMYGGGFFMTKIRKN